MLTWSKIQSFENSSGHDVVFYSNADTRDRAKFHCNRRIFRGPPGKKFIKIICNNFAIILVRHLKAPNFPATHAHYLHTLPYLRPAEAAVCAALKTIAQIKHARPMLLANVL